MSTEIFYADLVVAHALRAGGEDDIIEALGKAIDVFARADSDVLLDTATAIAAGEAPDLLGSFKQRLERSSKITTGAKQLVAGATALADAYSVVLGDKLVRAALRSDFGLDVRRAEKASHRRFERPVVGWASQHPKLAEVAAMLFTSPSTAPQIADLDRLSLGEACERFGVKFAVLRNEVSLPYKDGNTWTQTSSTELLRRINDPGRSRETFAVCEALLDSGGAWFLLVLYAALEIGAVTPQPDVRAQLRVFAVRALLQMNAAETAHKEAISMLNDAQVLRALPVGERRRLRMLVAKAASRSGRIDEAIERLFEAYGSDPSGSTVLGELALLAVERDPSASQTLCAAAAQDPAALAPNEALLVAEALRRMKKLDLSLAVSHALARQTPGPEPLMAVANVGVALGRPSMWSAAVQAYFERHGLSVAHHPAIPIRSFSFQCAGAKAVFDHPLITVVMTAHDSAATIELAANSVLHQTCRNVELVIVDDASSDLTPEIVALLSNADRRVRSLRLPRNVGTYVARNIGISVARGEFVTFHDSDDWMHPRRLELHLAEMGEDVSCTTSNWVRMCDDGHVETQRGGCFAHLNPSSMFFRRSTLESLGLFHGVRAGADAEIIARFRLQHDQRSLRHIDRPLAIGRHHETSLTQSSPAAFDAFRCSAPRLTYTESWLRWHIIRAADGLSPRAVGYSRGVTVSAEGTELPGRDSDTPAVELLVPEALLAPSEPCEPSGASGHGLGADLAERFKLANRAFAAGAFATAIALTKTFAREVRDAAHVSPYGSQAPSPELSIIVVSHQRSPGVPAALARIGEQASAPDIEVLLVDNGNDALFSIAEEHLEAFLAIKAPFNVGCSGGRNLGASFARGRYVLFLDDDGLIEEDTVAALRRCIEETGAVAVRGRVVPRSAPERIGVHYDLGSVRVPEIINAEGVSIWRREAFIEHGGFDPLLSGHEGLALCSRMWRFHGPMGFLYEPGAVLLHDYAADVEAIERKRQKHIRNNDYLDFLDLSHSQIRKTQIAARTSFPQTSVALQAATQLRHARGTPRVSVITTARGGRQFLADYAKSWMLQTYANAEVIFVDDHSDDGIGEAVGALWKGPIELQVLSNTGIGRSAALNTAIAHAQGEICVIADVDDISVPDRIARTVAYFEEHPDDACMSFIAYNEASPFRIGRPRSPGIADVAVRQLFGTPVSFPAFAFLRSAFPLPFDEALAGGVDYDWIHRNGKERRLRGKVLWLPAVYYRQHDGQISFRHNEVQEQVRRRCILSSFEVVLGEMTTSDVQMIDALVFDRRIANGQRQALVIWLGRFLDLNRERSIYDSAALQHALLEAFNEVRS